MPDNEIIHDAQTMPETAKEKFERERLTRRQALKRFGMTSAMTAFALFSVDDLAHIVGKAMQQRVGDNKIAGQIAKEFQQSGIALAAGASGTCNGAPDITTCQNNIRTSCNKVCVKTYAFPAPCELAVSNCGTNCAALYPGTDTSRTDLASFQQCYNTCIISAGFTFASYPC